VDGGFRLKSLDALQSDRAGEMGFFVNEKGERVFESGREPFHHYNQIERKRVSIDKAMSNVKTQSSKKSKSQTTKEKHFDI
jgi:hypothetical protein